MIAKVLSGAVLGLDGQIIDVEAAVSQGLPNTIIVGLPDAAVQESKERVRAAIKSSSLSYPQGRVSVNLAPADVPKIGSQYDIPIALSILLAAETVQANTQGKLFLGELSLDGRIRRVSGVLPQVLAAQAAGITEVYVPAANTPEALLVSGIKVYGLESLSELLAHLVGTKALPPQERNLEDVSEFATEIDFADIAGQEFAKRALEIGASGAHNLLFSGSPGTGKSMLAKAFVGILPALTSAEQLEITKIYSVSGRLTDSVIMSVLCAALIIPRRVCL